MFRCSHWHCGIFHSPFVMFDEYRLRIISCKCRSIGTRWKQKRIRGKGNGNLREWKRPRIRLCRMYRDRERQMPIILRFIYPDRLYLSGRYFSPSPNMKYDKKVFNSACLLVAPYQLFWQIGSSRQSQYRKSRTKKRWRLFKNQWVPWIFPFCAASNRQWYFDRGDQ